ncbi:hypothetical protein [Kitasatospora sp. NPDC088783]|uniref:hypothetical protein n=1 Tax=Kitasatospora sp. NPDC088783 TaxID=3364077 RepID=UPI00382665F0
MQDAIFVAAPEGTSWPLSVHDVEQQLQTRFPGIRTWHKYAPVSRCDYVDFEITADGEARHGSYFDRRHLILRDGTPEFWADTIAWLLALLPAATPAIAMVESNPDVMPPIPAGASTQQITDLLDSLLEQT